MEPQRRVLRSEAYNSRNIGSCAVLIRHWAQHSDYTHTIKTEQQITIYTFIEILQAGVLATVVTPHL